jgi:colanic acid/amylovoran biosynthesis glycosyltransferase
MKTDNPVVIVSKNYHQYSETFIHDSIRYWRGASVLLYGDYLPTHYQLTKSSEGIAFNQKPEETVSRWWPWSRITNDNSKKIAAFLKQIQPRAVLAHYGPTGVAMQQICRDLNLPLFVHFHGYDAYRHDILGKYGQFYQSLFNYASGVMVVSKHMYKQLRTLGAPESKLHLINYGVEPSDFPERELPAWPRFVFIGRFVEKKSPAEVVSAFSMVIEKLPGARLVMVGDGELRETCIALATSLGIKDKIHFTGVLQRKLIAELLSESYCLVLPSQHPPNGDSEGTPVVLLEAGAAGRPVIATRHGGIPDVIENGVTGILTEPGKVAALAEAMIYLGANPAIARQMGKAAKTRIALYFSRNEYMNALSSIIDRFV